MNQTETDSSEDLLEAVNISKQETIVASRVEWAGSSVTRRRGLRGRSDMHPEEGLYIVPCQWIHMFGMKFPIDVAFLSAEGRVLTIHHHLKPNRLSRISFRAEGALELAAGRLIATNTVVGDVIQFRNVSVDSQLS